MTNKLKQALIDNKVDVDSLIEQLRTISGVNTRNVPLLDEDVFARIRTVDDFWKRLSTYWNVYDYDLLRFIVKITKCREARNILEEFLSRIDPAIIEDVDLVLHCRVDKNEGWPKPILRIKINAEKCTCEIQKEVKEIVSEKYNLKEYCLRFKGIKEGCIELLYYISEALMAYFLECTITGSVLAEFSTIKIISIYINNVDILVSN